MKATVIICSFNRGASMGVTLESLAASIAPAWLDWEVLIVDNNSTDQTPQVCEDFQRRFPGRFRYVFEGRAGKSYALNRGIAEAAGEVLAFTDDDVKLDPAWLHQLVAPLKDKYWSGSGGRTLALDAFNPPPWLPVEGQESLAPVIFAHYDMGDKAFSIHQWPPYGANMAFRKSALEKHGGFRLDLGPSPDQTVPRPSEDTELGRRLLAAGLRICYVPGALVYHPVLESRMQPEYLLAWRYDWGRASIREYTPGSYYFETRPRWTAAARIALADLPAGAVAWLLAREPKQKFIFKCKVWSSAGRLVEMCRMLRESGGKKA